MRLKDKNKNIFVLSILSKLGINKPTKQQVNIVKSLLYDIGVVFFKNSFQETLSAKEIECLLWAARGKNLLETAKILGVKYSTIRTHHMRIKRKLACRTISQAVHEAVRYNYLTPQFADENSIT